MSVNTDAAVLTLTLWIAAVAFINIFLTAAGWRDGGKSGQDWYEIIVYE